MVRSGLKMASEKEDLNIYELLSTIGQTGYVPVQLISRFTKKTLTSGFSSNISMLFALFGTLDVLGSALKRKRLDGSTFKYLNMGVFLSSFIYTFKAIQSGVLPEYESVWRRYSLCAYGRQWCDISSKTTKTWPTKS